jgi:hypothetical protein
MVEEETISLACKEMDEVEIIPVAIVVITGPPPTPVEVATISVVSVTGIAVIPASAALLTN